MTRPTTPLLAAMLLATSVCTTQSALAAPDPERCSTVHFSDVGWTDITVTTAVTRYVLNELGYITKVKRLSATDTYKALSEGKVDVFLGNWMPSSEHDIRPYLDNGTVESLGANLTGAKYTLAVNQAAWDGGVKSFADLAKFKEQLGGRIYGIEPGNDGNALIQKMIKGNAFSLGDFKLVESSENGMLSQVKRAEHLNQWAVFLGWEPHPMNNQLQMHYLSGGDDWFGPNYGGATVYTNTRKGLTQECPNLGRLLKNLKFSLAMENHLMEAILNQSTNRRREAKAWLNANPDTLAAWLQGVTARDGGPLPATLAPTKAP
ncbi:choline ABC transporter substrate-binding protein [Pseudomonas sp. LFM046]|uniref:choline ABC transporter substrate-binding protein n=1 Tax=Pseudomonas sp. LFM046 TaxID=1608357 RepID=UPI0005CFEF6D|nr:choline ABC transporter substrate-binding protein [Pseudomonas sp. LFM046]